MNCLPDSQLYLMSKNKSFIEWIQVIKNGGLIDFASALALLEDIETVELAAGADELRLHLQGDQFDLCSIINGKAGRCTENCRFCAQSSWYETEIEEYSVVSTLEAIRQAKDNADNSVQRFSIVTAGRQLSSDQIAQFGSIFTEIQKQTTIKLCASMGMLTPEKAEQLKKYGVTRYHCNLEAARSFFPEVCTTHTYDEKVETIKIAQAAGFEICSGGILGIGESVQQRVELAFELRELGVLSIPVNILIPIPNTPLESVTPISFEDVIRAIAIFRIINPHAVIRLAGGRNQFGASQYECFTSGANGAIVGNFLTTPGNSLQEDLEQIKRMNFKLPGKAVK